MSIEKVQEYFKDKTDSQVSGNEFCPLMHKFELYMAVNLSYRGAQQCVTFECADQACEAEEGREVGGDRC